MKALMPTTAAPYGLQMLSVFDLMESPANPRKHFDDQTLQEMAASIRQQGIVSPLIVRPKGDRFEIAAGHRRFRAARIAGLDMVPAIVRELDDNAFLELLTLENIQREDVNELDEANGYQALIDQHGYTVKVLAGKIGRSEAYIYKRLKLTGAIPEVQELAYTHTISAGHVEQIARLPEVSQKVVLERGLFKKTRGEAAAVEQPFTLAEVLAEGPAVSRRNIVPREAVSTRELDVFIHEHIYSDLGAALFDLADANLLPEAGVCGLCAKRFGNSCADRACFQRKTNAGIDVKVKAGIWIPAPERENDESTPFRDLVEVQPGSCPNTQTVVGIDGSVRGMTKLVCLLRSCGVHYPKPLPPATRSVNVPPLLADPATTRQSEKRAETRKISDVEQRILDQLVDLREYVDRAMNFVERDELLLARGSIYSADSSLSRVKAAITDAVEDLRDKTAPAIKDARKSRRLAKRTAGSTDQIIDADLPGNMKAAVPYYMKLIRRYHAAVLAGDLAMADRLEEAAHNLALKLNGGHAGILADERKPGYVLPARTRAAKGATPLWGQQGNFTLKIRGVPMRIVVDGFFGVSFGGFEVHAVDRRQPFISETGYRSFLGERPASGLTIDRFVRKVIEAHIDAPRKPKRTSEPAGLGGQLVEIDGQFSHSTVTRRPGKTVRRPSKVSARTKTKGRR